MVGPEPPPQTPLVQVSPVVQLFPSSQGPPSLVGEPPMQAPFEQVVALVHALPSSQAAPSLPGTAEQIWLNSSQVAIQQPPGGAQTVGVPPPQTPPVHTVSCVQNWKSSHGNPSLAGTGWQTPI